MASRFRSVEQAWWALGFGCLLGAAMTGGLVAWQLAALDDHPIERSSGFVAVMQRENKGYVLQTAGQSRINCPSDRCGYPSVNADLGLSRTYYMTNGRLIGVDRDRQLVDLRDEIRAARTASLWIPAISGTLSLACFWTAMRARKAKSSDPLRTST